MTNAVSAQSDMLPEVVPRIGLALGGGGARGLAHVIVLEVFDELGIKPAAIAGTSIGALIGGAYAAGLSGARIRGHIVETLGNRFDLIRQLFGARAQPREKLLNVLPLRSSVLDPLSLLELVLPEGVPTDFRDLSIPFSATATDLISYDPVAITRGDLRPAIAASIAIPVLFSPVEIDGRLMADGGLADPLPFSTLAGAADILVGVDVCGGSSELEPGKQPSVITSMVQSVQIMQSSIVRERLKNAPPDLYLDFDLDQFAALEFYKAKTILEAAEPAKEQFKRKLLRVLAHPTAAIAESPLRD